LTDLLDAAQADCPTLPLGSTEVWAGGTWELVQQTEPRVQVDWEAPAPRILPPSGEPTGRVWRGPLRRTDSCGGVWERVGAGSGDSPLFTYVSPIPVSTDADVLDLAPEPDGESSFQAWYTRDCSGAGHRIHDTEDRVEIAAFNFRAQKANVNIFRFRRYYAFAKWNLAYDGECSGVMLDDDYMLTAAHCLADLDSTGKVWTGKHLEEITLVCSRGNKQGSGATCSTVSNTVINPGFVDSSTNGDVDQDWAVAVLDSPIVGPSETMALSSASPATWDDFLLRNMAYPGRAIGFDQNSTTNPTCDANVTLAQQTLFQDPIPDGDSMALWGKKLFRDTRSGADTNYSTTLAKTRFDDSSGASGSAYFICPAEDCSNTPEIVAVHSTYKSVVSHRYRGPRVNLFKTWVENNAP